MYVCMYVWMDVTSTFGGVLFVFGAEECIRHRSVLGESKHSSSKNGPPFRRAKTQNISNDSD
jgi:hypothetical protein